MPEGAVIRKQTRGGSGMICGCTSHEAHPVLQQISSEQPVESWWNCLNSLQFNF
jgi:hypothetical protein